jgi:hypothetical protein
VNIRLPSQSLILAGESTEVDSLVSRATMVEAHARGRAVVPVEMTAAVNASLSPQQSPALFAGSTLYGRSLSRPNSPADLYRSVQRFGATEPLNAQAHLDVFA